MCFVICRLQHENLVDMVGFSCDGQYPCVIYPLMSNGSLLDRLACLVSPRLATDASFGCRFTFTAFLPSP